MILSRARFGFPMFAALLAAAMLLAAGFWMARYEDQLYSAEQLKEVGEQARILGLLSNIHRSPANKPFARVMPLWPQVLPYYDLLVASQLSTLALHRTGDCRRLSLSAFAYEKSAEDRRGGWGVECRARKTRPALPSSQPGYRAVSRARVASRSVSCTQ